MQTICYNSIMSWQHRQLMRPFPTATSLVVAGPHLSPSYSVHGQLTNEVQNGVSLARTYDTLNRPTGYSLDEEESLRSLRLESSYDSLGRFASVSAPRGTRSVASAAPGGTRFVASAAPRRTPSSGIDTDKIKRIKEN